MKSWMYAVPCAVSGAISAAFGLEAWQRSLVAAPLLIVIAVHNGMEH